MHRTKHLGCIAIGLWLLTLELNLFHCSISFEVILGLSCYVYHGPCFLYSIKQALNNLSELVETSGRHGHHGPRQPPAMRSNKTRLVKRTHKLFENVLSLTFNLANSTNFRKGRQTVKIALKPNASQMWPDFRSIPQWSPRHCHRRLAVPAPAPSPAPPPPLKLASVCYTC